MRNTSDDSHKQFFEDALHFDAQVTALVIRVVKRNALADQSRLFLVFTSSSEQERENLYALREKLEILSLEFEIEGQD